MHARIVLASTSAYRRDILQRLGLSFETAAPNIDETPGNDEDAAHLVQRLACAKAEAVAARFPDALIIGSDQCAVLETTILGKPGDHVRATAQLAACSGHDVVFHTGLCLLDTRAGTDPSHRTQVEDVLYRVRFRELGATDIENYLRREQPYDCAGSFKSEGLGVALFECMAGDDPNALIGLPLIRLSAMLRKAGVDVLSASA